MPKFTFVEQQHQKRKQRQQQNPIYVSRLRQVLSHSRNSHSNSFNGISRSKSLQVNQQNCNKYHNGINQSIGLKNQKDQHETLYIIQQPTKNRNEEQAVGKLVKLPKLRKKHKAKKSVEIDLNEKLLIKNYMNAKLIEFKKAQKTQKPKKPKKSTHTIESVGQLPQNTKNYYIYRKAAKSEKKQSSISDASDGPMPRAVFSSRTLKLQYKDEGNKFQNTMPHKAVFRTNGNEKMNTQEICSCMNEKKQQAKKFSESTYQNSDKNNNDSEMSNQKSKQWRPVNPLNLQTFFVKLKKSGNSPNQTQLQNKKMKPIPQVPSTKQQITHLIKYYTPQYTQIKMQNFLKSSNFQIILQKNENQSQLYFGEIQNSKKHGAGIKLTNSSLFQGFWQNDQKIIGIQKTIIGKYEGQFFENKRQGKGEFYWNNGEYYSGEWKDGKKHGSGYWKSTKDQCYIGEWRNGEVTGYGVHTMKNGQKYQGQFVNFLKHGFGNQVFPNGDTYEGNYHEGQPEGNGRYTWKNGTYYEGQFQKGYRNGKGIMVTQKGVQFTGNFKNQVICGMGKLVEQNGDIYNGLFENNKKHGYGILQLKKQKQSVRGLWHQNQFIKQQ